MSHTPNSATYDSTVDQLISVAHDIEMQDAPPTPQQFLYVIIDTNVLIDYKTIIEQFCNDVERAGLPVKVVIPSVVLGELDGLKNAAGLQWFARQATTWLLTKVRERSTVKIQTSKETQSAGPRAEADEVRRNDLLIRDCGLYFNDKARGLGAVMVSMDKLHVLECYKEGIACYMPPQHGWSSRQLAQGISVSPGHLHKFHDRELDGGDWRYRPVLDGPRDAAGPKKKGRRLAHTEGPQDDDRMDVDAPPEEEYEPVHARDSLHVQMAEHFTLVLRELAQRVHKERGETTAVSNSAHAPAYRRTPLREWSAGLCLTYLETKKPLLHFRRAPWMPAFFVLRREKGWRKGQDWSTKMWEMALEMLEDAANKFEDGALLSSVRAVRPHVEEVWESKLRPL